MNPLNPKCSQVREHHCTVDDDFVITFCNFTYSLHIRYQAYLSHVDKHSFSQDLFYIDFCAKMNPEATGYFDASEEAVGVINRGQYFGI